MERRAAEAFEGLFDERVVRIFGVLHAREREPATRERERHTPTRKPSQPSQRQARARQPGGTQAAADRPRQHHRSFDQEPGADGQEHCQTPTARCSARAFPRETGPHDRHARGERHVENHIGREDREERRTEEQHTGPPSEVGPTKTHGELAHQDHGERRRERGGHAHRPGCVSQRAQRDRAHPEQAGRLVEVRHPGKRRDHQIAGGHHLPRHFGVTAFVGVEQRIGGRDGHCHQQGQGAERECWARDKAGQDHRRSHSRRVAITCPSDAHSTTPSTYNPARTRRLI